MSLRGGECLLPVALCRAALDFSLPGDRSGARFLIEGALFRAYFAIIGGIDLRVDLKGDGSLQS